MYTVIKVWVDGHNQQVGARLEFDDRYEDVLLADLQTKYRGLLTNAIVTNKGLRGKRGITLKREVIKRITDSKKRYIL